MICPCLTEQVVSRSGTDLDFSHLQLFSGFSVSGVVCSIVKSSDGCNLFISCHRKCNCFVVKLKTGHLEICVDFPLIYLHSFEFSQQILLFYCLYWP